MTCSVSFLFYQTTSTPIQEQVGQPTNEPSLRIFTLDFYLFSVLSKALLEPFQSTFCSLESGCSLVIIVVAAWPKFQVNHRSEALRHHNEILYGYFGRLRA
ncbi:hypothetical protein TRVL_09723 [Trypanosoma vivax]|nr:hypothetical protein TRVL_09723 [Trypanosoma vivax]